MPRLVMFEGVPGSGKTTTSRAVAGHYAELGGARGWALEEDAHHPFFDRDVRRRHRRSDYDDICIARWRHVVRRCESQRWVLDGCALQSTVRFMFEQAMPFDAIATYWQRFNDTVAPAAPRLVYFRHRDVEGFLRTHTVHVRASVWDKISAHVISTPVGRLLEGEEVDIPIEFWVRYASPCDTLVDQAAASVLGPRRRARMAQCRVADIRLARNRPTRSVVSVERPSRTRALAP